MPFTVDPKANNAQTLQAAVEVAAQNLDTIVPCYTSPETNRMLLALSRERRAGNEAERARRAIMQAANAAEEALRGLLPPDIPADLHAILFSAQKRCRAQLKRLDESWTAYVDALTRQQRAELDRQLAKQGPTMPGGSQDLGPVA